MYRTARLAAVVVALAAVLVCLAKPAQAAPIGDGSLVATPFQPSLNQPPQPWYFGVMLRRATTALGSGLRIDSMRSDGPVARAGLTPGDIILAAGGSNLQQVRSKLAALTILRGSVQAQPLPPGACQNTIVKGQVVLTVLVARTGTVNQVLVEPILKPSSTRLASARSTRPTVVTYGPSTLSIPATFDPLTGQRLSPLGSTVSLFTP